MIKSLHSWPRLVLSRGLGETFFCFGKDFRGHQHIKPTCREPNLQGFMHILPCRRKISRSNALHGQTLALHWPYTGSTLSTSLSKRRAFALASVSEPAFASVYQCLRANDSCFKAHARTSLSKNRAIGLTGASAQSFRVTFDLPELLEIQRASFNKFIEQGIGNSIAEAAPIKVEHDNIAVELVLNGANYQLIAPEETPRDSILKMKTYSCKLYVEAKAVYRNLLNGGISTTKSEWLLLAHLPIMTKRGHFIINGSPRVIVHQVVRSPGVYFQQVLEKDENKRIRFYGDIIPRRGVYLRLQITKKGKIEAKLKKGKKLSADMLQRCLQFLERHTIKSRSQERTLSQFMGLTAQQENKKYDFFGNQLVESSHILKNGKSSIGSADARTGSVIKREDKGLVQAANTNFSDNTSLGKSRALALTSDAWDAPAQKTRATRARQALALACGSLTQAELVFGPSFLPLAGKVDIATESFSPEQKIFSLRKSNRPAPKKTSLFNSISSPKIADELKIQDTGVEGVMSAAEEKALLYTYDKLYRPIEDKEREEISKKGKNDSNNFRVDSRFKLKRCYKNLFYTFKDKSRYDLGFLGREKINRKLGLHVSEKQLCALDIYAASNWLYKLTKGETSRDDIDHFQNRRIRTSGELLSIQFENGIDRLKKLAWNKLKEVLQKNSSHKSILEPQQRGSISKSKSPAHPKALVHSTKCCSAEAYTSAQLTGNRITNSSSNRRRARGTARVHDINNQALAFLVSRKQERTKDRKARIQPNKLYSVSNNWSQAPAEQTRALTRAELVMHGLEPMQPAREARVFRASANESAENHFFLPPLKELFSTKPINGALRELFGSNPLSQYMDQTNPLAEVTHKRRMSSLGVGGISRESAGMAIRGIHPTHYGRICPIETPEGKNAGLVNSLAFCAKINDMGFVESPYYKVFKGQIQRELGFQFFSAKKESISHLNIAPSDLHQSWVEMLATDKVPVRVADNVLDLFKKIDSYQVDCMLISPVQMISVATSLIPFLEHNDANRALMGSNMQRQAVPLMIPERPIVGTGLESLVLAESGQLSQSEMTGFVSYVSADKIVIESLSCRKQKASANWSYPLTLTRALTVFPRAAAAAMPALVQLNTLGAKQASSVGRANATAPIITDATVSSQSRKEAGKAPVRGRLELGLSQPFSMRPLFRLLSSALFRSPRPSSRESVISLAENSSNFQRLQNIQATQQNKLQTIFQTQKQKNSKSSTRFTKKSTNFAQQKINSLQSSSQAWPSRQRSFLAKALCASAKQEPSPMLPVQLCTRRTGAGKLVDKLTISNRYLIEQAHTCFNRFSQIDCTFDSFQSVWSKGINRYLSLERDKSSFSKASGTLVPFLCNIHNFDRSNQDTCLTERALVKEGDWVQRGDILTDCSASDKGELAVGKNVMVAYIPWEGYNFEDAIVISERLVKEHIYTSLHIERYDFKAQDLKEGSEWFTNDLPGVPDSKRTHLDEFGLAKVGTFVKEGDILVGKMKHSNKKPTTPYERLLCDIIGENNFAARDASLYVPKGVHARVIKHKIVSFFENSLQFRPKTLKSPFLVHIFLGEKRAIQVGDKMSGRHGNKGVVATILPRQDMPYMGDGTPIDIILNPLGVPSRMNVGQVLESLLGLAGTYLAQHFKIMAFDELYGVEASQSLVYLKLYQARLQSGENWLFQVDFPGKTRLIDGRSGECFDQWVTVGKAYMLKLIHMVKEKIHARATGPYALITQQPLRGRAQKGGQRLGEMEVWALEGFGAAYTLQELCTKKSDDMVGRKEIASAILPRPISVRDNLHPLNRIQQNRAVLGQPEIFKVLICELQALCLDVGVYSLTTQSFQRCFLSSV